MKTADAALVEEFQAGEIEAVRRLARAHTREAIQTLVKLMKAPKTPPGVKRACAADILNQGWGRPDARADGGSGSSKGLVINILKLSTGVTEQITHASAEMEEVIDAADIAKLITENTVGDK